MHADFGTNQNASCRGKHCHSWNISLETNRLQKNYLNEAWFYSISPTFYYHKIMQRAIFRPRTLRLYQPLIAPARLLSTARPINRPKQSRFAIASAITLGSGYLIYSSTRPPAHSEQLQPLSAFTTSTPNSVQAELDDNLNRIAVKSKSTSELMLSLAIYKACATSWLVDVAPHLIAAAEKVGLSAPVYWIIKRTFFQQFCGGESADECSPVMERLSRFGIGSILDLSIEADIDHPGDRDEYAERADAVTQLTKECVRAAAGEGGMAAIKVTAFSSPMMLLNVNKFFERAREEFIAHMDDNGRIRRTDLVDITFKLTSGQAQVDLMPLQETEVDWIDYMQLLSPKNSAAQTVMAAAGVSKDDINDFKSCLVRLEQVCDMAKQGQVKIMVDAEQSYFQRTIDHIAMHLQSKYNQRTDEDDASSPVVLNTCKAFFSFSFFYFC